MQTVTWYCRVEKFLATCENMNFTPSGFGPPAEYIPRTFLRNTVPGTTTKCSNALSGMSQRPRRLLTVTHDLTVKQIYGFELPLFPLPPFPWFVVSAFINFVKSQVGVELLYSLCGV